MTLDELLQHMGDLGFTLQEVEPNQVSYLFKKDDFVWGFVKGHLVISSILACQQQYLEHKLGIKSDTTVV